MAEMRKRLPIFTTTYKLVQYAGPQLNRWAIRHLPRVVVHYYASSVLYDTIRFVLFFELNPLTPEHTVLSRHATIAMEASEHNPLHLAN